MPIYNVVMEQAISVANLGGNTLMTGNGDPADSLQSCAAIILWNPTTGAAGLYHYPAGNIVKYPKAQLLLAEMIRDIAPTQCSVIYGTTTLLGFDNEPSTKASDGHHDALVSHLGGMLDKVKVNATAAGAARVATISMAAGVAQIGLTVPDGGITDLRQYTPGVQTFGKIYWARDQDAPPPPKGCCTIL